MFTRNEYDNFLGKKQKLHQLVTKRRIQERLKDELNPVVCELTSSLVTSVLLANGKVVDKKFIFEDSESELSESELQDLKSYQISTKVLESSSLKPSEEPAPPVETTPNVVEDSKTKKKRIEDEMLAEHGALASLFIAKNNKS
jgi:hypothetical protein